MPIIDLLDLLAGWAAYAEDPDDLDEEDRAKPEVIAHLKATCKAAEINALYQEAGALENPTDDEIAAFVHQRVIPLILKRD